MNQALANTAPQEVGLFHKFEVRRTDGKDAPGGSHEHDKHFVLELTQDPHSIPAIAAYATSCAEDYPALAVDLRSIVNQHYDKNNEFVIVPETTLPGGLVVPSFQVGKYACSKSVIGTPLIVANRKPWHNINYHEAVETAKLAGFNLITETQHLAIAYQITQQDENWTGGKVGEGEVIRGIHKGNVNEAQAATYESDDPSERSWHVLANGERIYHFSGNLYTWVFDNVQGDDKGIIAKRFAEDSISKTTPPYGNREHGIGDHDLSGDWSGRALIRGGYWSSLAYAGVFCVGNVGPSRRRGYVGFRVTKSL